MFSSEYILFVMFHVCYTVAKIHKPSSDKQAGHVFVVETAANVSL